MSAIVKKGSTIVPHIINHREFPTLFSRDDIPLATKSLSKPLDLDSRAMRLALEKDPLDVSYETSFHVSKAKSSNKSLFSLSLTFKPSTPVSVLNIGPGRITLSKHRRPTMTNTQLFRVRKKQLAKALHPFDETLLPLNENEHPETSTKHGTQPIEFHMHNLHSITTDPTKKEIILCFYQGTGQISTETSCVVLTLKPAKNQLEEVNDRLLTSIREYSKLLSRSISASLGNRIQSNDKFLRRERFHRKLVDLATLTGSMNSQEALDTIEALISFLLQKKEIAPEDDLGVADEINFWQSVVNFSRE